MPFRRYLINSARLLRNTWAIRISKHLFIYGLTDVSRTILVLQINILQLYVCLQNHVSSSDSNIRKKDEIQIKVEAEDEVEIVEPEDIFNNICETENETYDQSQNCTEYDEVEPGSKKARSSEFQSNSSATDNSQNRMHIQKPEITITRTPRHERFISTNRNTMEEDIDEEEETATSTICDNIELFGKFVSSQMRQITNKTLLIKLQHTIQTAIMDAQLRQIEMDDQ